MGGAAFFWPERGFWTKDCHFLLSLNEIISAPLTANGQRWQGKCQLPLHGSTHWAFKSGLRNNATQFLDISTLKKFFFHFGTKINFHLSF